MKTLILFFIVTAAYAQNSFYYYPDGTIIKKSNGTSINDLKAEYFPNVKMTNTYFGHDEKDCEGYVIVFKKYTETPLFITGELPKKKKKVKKCIESYTAWNLYDDDFQSDLDNMLKNKVNTEYIKQIFGNPYNKTIDTDATSEFTIYNYSKYYGHVKFDLVFENDVLIRYIRN